MYNALVIGCGNIGARYDLEKTGVLSHAKAYHQKGFDLTVYDIEKGLQNAIADKYNAKGLEEVSASALKAFDCISICTPTDTHRYFLELALQAEVNTVICEKPVSNDLSELARLKELYRSYASKVLVNYIRRFQPAYQQLRQDIDTLRETDSLTGISIRYYRGFINNCSHAFDLIEFLFGGSFELSDIQKSRVSYDHFKTDPTITINANWNNVPISVLGLTGITFPVFEIEIFFSRHRVSITNSGATITIYEWLSSDTERSNQFEIKKQLQDSIKDYMMPVIDFASGLIQRKKTEDNFIQALELNQRMLNIIH